MPGRRDAGKIWQETLDRFLTGFGLAPPSFDPRCFYLAATDGILIALTHVDDARLTGTGCQPGPRWWPTWTWYTGTSPMAAPRAGSSAATGSAGPFAGRAQHRHHPPSESSTAGELHQVAPCIKAVTGLRIFLGELHAAPTRPTATYTDSQVMLDAMGSARVSKESKWISTCLAMARHYKASGTGEFHHIPGLENPADMLTKPLPAPQFAAHRARALGHVPPN
jgi:hypothetical protein